ncbi:hypothetical protein KUL72_05955 [Bradyrhizobium arachidis]|uniref:hypothetical protein n=1 Tax=Bradyrhizobium TaxID=374 RepID=UPI0021628B27|nr:MULTISPECIES: hypothetical protein [Bradyrhizobium]MDN4984750.1 hypothetical protein [Bradyrhizobium sp. WYCCWR 13022]UVO37930.1 hypothetical protein KUL72_05955 [Bradyrhizobium arachidis]
MLKYLAKISMDIFPSVLATIIGAYIVNHYINAKPAADTPAAVVAPANAGKKPADVANLPAPGVKARGVSEKSISDKSATDKPAAEKPGETKAADEAPSHGRTPAHEKAVAKTSPVAPTPAAPVVEANSASAVASPAVTPDANDLARAAIERLRKSPEGKAAEKAAEAKSEIKPVEVKAAERPPEPAVQEASRTPEAPRVITAVPSTVRPLPPPINVSTPSSETFGNGGAPQANSPYTASIGNDDPNRLTPPADIPVPMIAPPLDLRADAGAAASTPRPKTNVADEMLSGMKSMFHAVLPKGATPD